MIGVGGFESLYEPRHVLIVPSDEYRVALCGDGPCGSRAPVALPRWSWTPLGVQFDGDGRWDLLPADRPEFEQDEKENDVTPFWLRHCALVVGFGGAGLPDGISRLNRVWRTVIPRQSYCHEDASISEFVRMSRGRCALAAIPGRDPSGPLVTVGRFVLLGADLREVA